MQHDLVENSQVHHNVTSGLRISFVSIGPIDSHYLVNVGERHPDDVQGQDDKKS